MFISRFWTLLLAFAVALMLSVVMLARDLVNREREEYATASVYKEMDKVSVALSLHARKRLDVLLSASADKDVRQMMAEVSRDSKNADKHRQKLLTVLRERNKDLGIYSADMLMALDSTGRVIVQVGTKGREHGFNLRGFPVVDAALRGYVRDDVWKLANEVYFVAARPIIEGNRYVGALLHAMKITDKLASNIAPAVQLAFYQSNSMVAIGTPKTEGAVLAQASQIAGHLQEVLGAKQYQEKGYSEIRRIETDEQDFVAIYGRIKGEAVGNDVGWAVVTPVPGKIALTSFYEEAGSQDIQKLPIVLIVLLSLLVVALGWLWNYLEAERPLGNLLKAVVALETADIKDQLNIYKYRRKVRKLAAAFNKLMDIKTKAIAESIGASPKSIDAILGPQDSSRLSSANFQFAEAMSDDIPPPPPAALNAPPPDAVAPKSANGGGPPPAPQGAAPQRPQSPPTGPQRPVSSPQQAISPQEELAYFKKIHQEFLILKKQLGEPTEQLTYERFEVTLKKNRDALKARYGCKAVKFQVYEKGGKASLKATPIQ